MRKPTRRALAFGAAMLATALPLTLASAGSAGAASNGTVSLNTSGTVTTGPYSSGQFISISVGANATLDNASLVTAGYASGAVAIKAVECADPYGATANLPTTPRECDPNTVASITGANADGSMLFPSFQVFALPDSTSYGEPLDGTPVCGTFPNACVVGLFANVNDFTKPHIFSAPFLVSRNSNDGGGSPGAGGLLLTAPTILPPATRGDFYTYTFHGTGGLAPYKFKRYTSHTTVPKGLKLVAGTGVLSGTPKSNNVPAGTYHFTVELETHHTHTIPEQTFYESFTLQLQ